jgi:Leucine-rich repeat (LRR) protein
MEPKDDTEKEEEEQEEEEEPTFCKNTYCITLRNHVLPNLLQFNLLVKLVCCDIFLTELPFIPRKLRVLDCSRNKLTRLPSLNNELRLLFCGYNYLTELPALNHKLEVLSCGFNYLKRLPNLNEKLEYLICYHNQLTRLPELNQCLTKLYCSNNCLTVLPFLHEKLCALNFLDNHFIIYPELTKEAINCINQFRETYYLGKFGKRIFYFVLKRRMDLYLNRREILDQSARLATNPSRIAALLESETIDLNEWDWCL